MPPAESDYPMKTQSFSIEHIPAVLYGEPADRVWLFLHGQQGSKAEGAAFAQVVCPKGCQVLAIDLPGHGARSGHPEELVPWTAVPEIDAVTAWARTRWPSLCLRANSIGAWLALLGEAVPDRALLVSPILDMAELIQTMMGWAGVTEDALRNCGEIPTDFGQTLSWRYLCYAREHPLRPWACPTHILYGSRDTLTPRPTAEAFARRPHVHLTIREEGEHWFHTPAQLAVLAAWEAENS